MLLMYEGDDWKPEGVRASTDTPDPTASRAIYAVDELADKLDALRAEERELTDLIGESIVIIEAVKRGFGEKYADVLDAHYIDGETWAQIAECYESPHEGKETVSKWTVRGWAHVALDWIDSVGVSRLLRGEVEV